MPHLKPNAYNAPSWTHFRLVTLLVFASKSRSIVSQLVVLMQRASHGSTKASASRRHGLSFTDINLTLQCKVTLPPVGVQKGTLQFLRSRQHAPSLLSYCSLSFQISSYHSSKTFLSNSPTRNNGYSYR